jgi:hypothetical protein
MLVKTILNRVQRQPGFVYGGIRLRDEGGQLILEAELRARANRQPRCSQCHRPRPGYDTLAPRRFEFVPVWGIPVFFLYARQWIGAASRLPCSVVHDGGVLAERVNDRGEIAGRGQIARTGAVKRT